MSCLHYELPRRDMPFQDHGTSMYSYTMQRQSSLSLRVGLPAGNKQFFVLESQPFGPPFRVVSGTGSRGIVRISHVGFAATAESFPGSHEASLPVGACWGGSWREPVGPWSSVGGRTSMEPVAGISLRFPCPWCIPKWHALSNKRSLVDAVLGPPRPLSARILDFPEGFQKSSLREPSFARSNFTPLHARAPAPDPCFHHLTTLNLSPTPSGRTWMPSVKEPLRPPVLLERHLYPVCARVRHAKCACRPHVSSARDCERGWFNYPRQQIRLNLA